MIKRRKTNFKITLFIAIAILLSVCSFLIFQNKSFKYCSNERELLGITDTIKEINLILKQNKEKLIEDINSQYNYDISDKLLKFKIKLSNDQFIGMSVLSMKKYFYCGFNTKVIYINRNNQLLLEEQLIEKEKVKNIIYNLLLSQNYYDKFNLSLEWERTSSLQTIENVLIQIKEAYQLYYQTKAKEKFNKNICELNEEELSEINQLNYSLIITKTYLDKIPPPPPIPKY